MPAVAKTLAIVVTDPDAPKGTFVHWILYDVPARTTGLADGAAGRQALPPGADEGTNSKGETGWSPLCPPWGRHHYHFRVYALRDALVVAHPTLAELERAMNGLIVAEDETVGTYERSGK